MIRTYDKFLFNTFLRLNAVELKFLLRVILLMDNAVLFHMLEYIHMIELDYRVHYVTSTVTLYQPIIVLS